MDIGSRRYETFDDLYRACIRVASAVGLMCLEIFGYRDPRARDYAVDLGVALQLTNILRDVPEDLARGRVYIPQEDLRRFGCTEDDLRDEAKNAGGGVRSTQVQALLRHQGAAPVTITDGPRWPFRAATRAASSRRKSWGRSTKRS